MTFLRTKRTRIQISKAHDNLCFPLRRAYLVPLLFALERVMVIFTNFFFRLYLGERHMLGKDLYSYINLEMSTYALLLLTLPLR